MLVTKGNEWTLDNVLSLNGVSSSYYTDTLGWYDNGGTNVLRFEVIRNDGGNTTNGSTELSTGVWYHLALVRTAANSHIIYLNGAVEETYTGTVPDGQDVATVRIGDHTSAGCVSRLAAVKLYTASLTAAEIHIEMYTTLPKRTENLFAWLPCLNGSGERALDYSGNGRNFTEVGTITDDEHPPISWGGIPLFFPFAAAGGTVNNLSVSGAVTSAGTLTRQARATKVGAVTSAGLLSRATTTTKTGATTPAGTLTRRTGTAKTGAVTSAGTLTRATGKAVSGAVTSAGTLARATGKALVGTTTPTGAVTKRTATTFAGAVTSEGVLTVIRVVLLSVAGVVTSAGTLTRATGKALSGAVASAGTLTKQTARTFAGAVTSSGTLATIKTFLLVVSGAVTSAGTLTRLTGKALSGAATSAGTLTKQTATTFAGAVTSSGALATIKTFLLSVAGVVTSSGTLARQTGKSLAGSLSSAGALTRQTAKSFTGALASSGLSAVAEVYLNLGIYGIRKMTAKARSFRMAADDRFSLTAQTRDYKMTPKEDDDNG
jgi:hypothetical protein